MKWAVLSLVIVVAPLTGCVSTSEDFSVTRDELGSKPTPERCREMTMQLINGVLRDPNSAIYRNWTDPRPGYSPARWGGLLGGGMIEQRVGWIWTVEVNAKNAFGGYVGFDLYECLLLKNGWCEVRGDKQSLHSDWDGRRLPMVRDLRQEQIVDKIPATTRP